MVLDDELMEDRFAVSVRMSSYLVAFIVCDFRSVSATTASGVKVGMTGAAVCMWVCVHVWMCNVCVCECVCV